MTLPISVIIPTMNRPDALRRTIATIFASEDIPAQIIVVDQSIQEETRVRNKLYLFEYDCRCKISYVYQELASSTKARNTGMRQAVHHIFVISDDDVDVEPDTMRNVYTLMSDPSIAMIAGIDTLTQKSQCNIGYLFNTKSYIKRNVGHVTLSMLGRYPDNVVGEVETEWAMGYFFAVRKSCIKAWNLTWDEKLTSYAYAEDLDFSHFYYKYAKKNGLRCILSDQVKVAHLASEEYRVPSKKATCMYIINRMYLSYKHNKGICSRFLILWNTIGRVVEQISRNESPKYLLTAQLRALKYLSKIKRGDLSGKLYE